MSELLTGVMILLLIVGAPLVAWGYVELVFRDPHDYPETPVGVRRDRW